MKLNFPQLRTLAVLWTVAVMNHPAGAATNTNTWTGAGGDLLWSNPANWSLGRAPGSNDEVRFFDDGATNDVVSINNIISANVTIERLWVGPTNGVSGTVTNAVHNMLINQGVTLTVRGASDNGSGPIGSQTPTDPHPLSTFYVGTKDDITAATVVSNTISGGGTLVLNNTNNELNVRQIISNAHNTGGGHWASLDMSGLGAFIAHLGRIRIGDGEAEPVRRAQGFVRLARTNNVTLSGPNQNDNVQLVIGNNDVNNSGNGAASSLYLGQQNTLSIDEILVGARKTPGNIFFNSIFTTPSVQLRGSDGTSRVRALRIGDESNQNNSSNPTTGTVDLSNGTVDIMADTVIVGKHQTGGGGGATGILTLGAGTLDANTLDLADQTDAQADTSASSGTATFIGTTVRVNGLLRLGRSAGGDGAINAALNVDGGRVTVAGSYANQGTVNIGLTNAQLNLPSNSRIAANNVTVDGSTISNATALTVTNQLTVLNGGAIAGSPAFNMGNSGAANWDFILVPGGLVVSNSLSGSGNLLGDLTVSPGASVIPAGDGVGATALNVSGNLTLNGARLLFDLSSSATDFTSDLLTAGANLTLSGSNDVVLRNLGASLDTANKYTLISYFFGTLAGDASNLRLAGPLAQSRYTFAFETATPTAIQLTVGGLGPKNLTWVGDGTANNWDTKGTANWNDGVAASQFFSLDTVTFNDSGSASPAVNLAGELSPGSFTVNNPTKNYTFNGTGGAATGGGLTKEGAGALTFNNTGSNSFRGALTINNGAVTFSNTGLNTFGNGLTVNGGSVIFSGDNANTITAGSIQVGAGTTVSVANANANDFGSGGINIDGSLTFNQSADATVSSVISGAGSLTKAGTNILTISGANTLSSMIHIDAGTLRAGSATALGTGGATIASGAKLDLYGQNLGTTPITVSGSGPNGEGAIVSTAGAQGVGVANVVLAGGTTFGGSGTWNTDPVLNVGLWTISASLSTGNQPYNLTKVGLNQVTLSGATVDTALGDIDVQQGVLGFRGATTSMGDSTKTLTVRAGATVTFFDTTTPWDKKFALFGDGVTPNFYNWNGANTIVGPVTLSGNCVLDAAPPDRGTPASLTLSGSISGSGGLTKTSADTLVLGGLNTYTGDTLVSAGTLALTGNGSISGSSNVTVNSGATVDVSGRTDGTLTLGDSQTLRGNGSITGNLIENAGAAVSPGVSVGALTVSGDITLHGTTFMELDASLDASDVLHAAVINYGGALSLSNLAGSLASGDSFKLFDAGSYNGSFASIVPATPGPGLTWDTTTLTTDGTLRIGGGGTAPPEIGGVSVSGGDLVLNGTGGTPGGTYTLLTSSNIALPLINWTPVLTRMFDNSGNFSVTNGVDPSASQRYFLLRVP